MRKAVRRPVAAMVIGPLCIVLVATILGVQPNASAQQPRRGGVLRIAHIGEAPTLDQQRTPSATTADFANLMNEGLFALDSKFQPQPMLVDRWSMSSNRRSYTFVLRRGVKFHNGKELTSADVKASLERWGQVSSRGRALFANVQAISTPDPLTVVFQLRDPYTLLPTDLAADLGLAAIHPKEVVDEAGTAPLRRFISTGPYRFVEHLPDRHVRFDRFEEYAARPEPSDGQAGRKHAYFDSIFIVPVPDAAVRIAGVRRGDFHFAKWVPTDEFARLQAIPEVTPAVAQVPWELVALFNHSSGLMTNPKLRQAFQAAIDYEVVLRGTFGPERFWRLNPGILAREHPMWVDAGRELYNQKNLDKARRLLAEAGYQGQPVRWVATMEILPYGTSAQIVKPMLERAGFVIDLQIMDWSTNVSRIVRTEGWDVFSTALTPQADPTFLVVFHPGGVGFYDNREINAMMALLRRHPDHQVRRQIWARLQRHWYEDAGFIKYGDYFQLNIHRRELRGYTNVPSDIWWNAWFEGR